MGSLERLDALAAKIESILSGDRVADPLYISNRTLRQKIRLALLVAVPAAAFIGVTVLALNRHSNPRQAADNEPSGTPETGRAVTSKLLPDTEKNVTTDPSQDVDVLEASVSSGSNRTLSGKIRNRTNHLVPLADVLFSVHDVNGAQLGVVAVKVKNIAPNSIAAFQLKLEHPTAAAVIVREVRLR
jgi:outer membrane receptor protein involved in Fe transport